MNVPFLMRISHVWWQHFKTNWFANDTSRQITLCVENFAIFIGVFIDNGLILVQQFINGKIDICCLRTRKIALGTVIDVFLCDGIFISCQKLMLNDISSTSGDNLVTLLLAFSKSLYIFSASKLTERPSRLMTLIAGWSVIISFSNVIIRTLLCPSIITRWL